VTGQPDLDPWRDRPAAGPAVGDHPGPVPPIITFDLEEWFHLLECRAIPEASRWSEVESRVVASTERILALLERRRVKATFFSLGWIARRHPALLRQIAALGHDLGCHSDMHSLVWRQSPEAFREETARALGSIADATGSPVHYYRAPGFSITGECLWAFEILMELGITADSSVFPGAHAHGGTRALFPDRPFRFAVNGRTLQEFPVSLAGIGPAQLAFVGGGYFRLLPLPLIAHWTRRRPGAVTYFHPRDFDPDQPRIPGLSLLRRFKSYVGISGATDKLDQFLARFGGQPLSRASARIPWEDTPLVRVS
jgi:polysaccharide deacetylase family protein (PEP-CTERM system associated)